MSLRERLRALPSIVGTAPPLGDIPENPRSLIIDFLTAAIDAEIPEPHAITLITVDSDNRPDARVLIIKDIDEQGNIAIATSGHSAKGRQLSSNPQVALSWYCTPHARAIRIRGTACLADPEVRKADFEARSSKAKAIAMAGEQSSAIPPDTDRKALIDAKAAELEALASAAEAEAEGEKDGSGEGTPKQGMDWQVWLIAPEEIEFWQGAKDRNHERLKYTKREGGWEHATLWP